MVSRRHWRSEPLETRLRHLRGGADESTGEPSCRHGSCGRRRHRTGRPHRRGRPGRPDGPGWFVVVTQDSAVAAALSADDLTGLPCSAPVRQALPVSRATVTVHPDCTVVAAISSWAIAEAETWAVAEAGRSVAMVVRRDAEVTGVWAGADLDEVLEVGMTRSWVDLTIPGETRHIPEIVRMCAFEAEGIRCDAVAASLSHPLGRSRVTTPGKCRSISSTGKWVVVSSAIGRASSWLSARGPVPGTAGKAVESTLGLTLPASLAVERRLRRAVGQRPYRAEPTKTSRPCCASLTTRERRRGPWRNVTSAAAANGPRCTNGAQRKGCCG